MDLGDVLSAVRRRWWLLPGGLLLGLAIGAAWNAVATPLYSSSVHLFVSTAEQVDGSGPRVDGFDAGAAYEGHLYAQRRSASYADALRSEGMAGRVVDELGLDLSAAEVADKITATVAPDTVLLEATVTDVSADRARDIAAALGDQFAQWVSTAENPVGPASTGVRATVVEAADLDTRKVSPVPGLTLGLGGVLGLLLGLGLAVLSMRSRGTVSSEEDVRRLTAAPLLGTVPDSAGSPHGSPAAPEEIRAFRAVRANLQLLEDAGPPRLVVVLGAVEDDGAAGVARGLAAALALAGRRVAVVGADLAHGELDTASDVPGGLSLGHVLAREAPLPEAAGAAREQRPSGTVPIRAELAALLASRDHVVLHTPYLESPSDAAVVEDLAGGCVLAVRHGWTRQHEVTAAVDALASAGIRLLGVVLVGVPAAARVVRSGSYRYSADPDRGGAVAARRAVAAPEHAATAAGAVP